MWDLFFNHASEDKATVVDGLVDRLEAKGIRIWYDKTTLGIGDSLREKIDHGLRNSRYAVVVLSPSFFNKQWANWELDGLIALGSKLLPVWHDVTASDVKNYSAPLANLVAFRSSEPDRVVAEIVKKVCSYNVTDHTPAKFTLDVSLCEFIGHPVPPAWLNDTPNRMCSDWLVDRFNNGSHLRVYKDSQGIYFVVDPQQEYGVTINPEQLREIAPPSGPITTTTTPAP